jgi:hypothetical protein
MADVKGGRGVTGMSFSGKGNLEKPSSGKLARELGSTVSKTTAEKTSGSYPRIGFGAITPPGTSSRMLAQKFSTKYKPGEYAAYRKAMAAKKPAVAAVKPVVKPVAQVISNVTSEKPSPTKKATPRAKPPATRFGVVTGKTTGTTMRGGGGYGGGGTRGSGSLSGGGSGTRSAGTSRTGGTQRNDPVRG